MKTIFIYQSCVEDKETTLVFSEKKAAEKYLKTQVSQYYGTPFQNIKNVIVIPDEIRDGKCFWRIKEDMIVRLPKNEYQKIDIGRYQVSFNGTVYENDYPYGLVQIFEFESADEYAKPLHGGRALLTFYTEFGGPELVMGTDEKFVQLLVDNIPENSRQNLYYWYKTWMYL